MGFMETITERECHFKRVIKNYHSQHFLRVGSETPSK